MVFIRLILASIFLLSGFEKASHPYQNFLYAIEAYQFFPSFIATVIAMVFPWVELLIGVFLFLGLWTGWALRAALVCFCCFILILAQAFWRGLALEQCGCFGSLISIPPQWTLIMDSFCLFLTWLSLQRLPQTRKLSLDIHLES